MNWPKYDPRAGFWLCENCWNRGNWTHHCHHGICECPKPSCSGADKAPQRIKFTGEGQTKISMEDPLVIKADS